MTGSMGGTNTTLTPTPKVITTTPYKMTTESDVRPRPEAYGDGMVNNEETSQSLVAERMTKRRWSGSGTIANRHESGREGDGDASNASERGNAGDGGRTGAGKGTAVRPSDRGDGGMDTTLGIGIRDCGIISSNDYTENDMEGGAAGNSTHSNVASTNTANKTASNSANVTANNTAQNSTASVVSNSNRTVINSAPIPASALRKSKKRNIVAVIGTTGVGKSQYAVDLAGSLSEVSHHQQEHQQEYYHYQQQQQQQQQREQQQEARNRNEPSPPPFPRSATILSSDSMQLYTGLPLITNKITPEEMEGVEHWGVGVVEPVTGGGTWEVGKWCLEAAGKIASMDPSNELPIICGGTHYYTQHFLFPPSRSLSTDRRRSRSGSGSLTATTSTDGTNEVRKSKNSNTKWRPPSSLEELLETLGTLEDRGERESAVMRRIREDQGEYRGVGKFLETFWTSTPIYPSGWVQASSESATTTLHESASTEPDTVSHRQVRGEGCSSSTPAASSTGKIDDRTLTTIKPANTTTVSSKDQELLAQHRLLTLVDPSEAGRWHWRDGRKVRRGLERFWEDVIASGRTLPPPQSVERETSTLQQDSHLDGGERGVAAVGKLGESEESPSASAAVGDDTSNDGAARFRTLIFWVYEDLAALASRLDRRVDKMVERGLIDEIKQLRQEAVPVYGSEETIDHQEGIFQSIGYKEFAHIPTERLTPTNPLFAPALERMKIATRQYAKRQLKWVEKQLLPVIRQALLRQRQVEKSGEGEVDDGVWVYVVRGGDTDTALGAEILRQFLDHEPMPDYRAVGHPRAAELLKSLEMDDPLLGEERNAPIVPDIQQRQVLNARQDCEICSTPGQPVSLLKSEWDIHLKSKTHRRSKHRWERENGLAPDFTAVREEAARRKAAKDEEARLLRERLEQEDNVGVL